jgi:type VI secretion system protein ImpG
MIEKLFPYYQNELVFFRELAREFAKKYPRPASRLLLDQGQSTDPHVERLIESFAFLTARIQHKLDDDFPELTDALLGVLYPHYLAPIPSMALVQFILDPGGTQLPNGFTIPQHSILKTPPIEEMPCTYRTGYPVTLWPIAVTNARLQPPPFPSGFRPPPQTAAALRLQLECQTDMTFQDLELDKLRFFLAGVPSVTAKLYELIFNHTLRVVFRPLDRDANQTPLELKPEQCLHQVGFERVEGLLPYPNQSFLGYRLLTEFFAFPSKFLFVDLGGWERVRQTGLQSRVEVILYLNRTDETIEQAVNTGTFCLGCTPVINLFEKKDNEPIRLSRTQFEYPVVPDRAHLKGLEVYSVDSVVSTDLESGQETEYHPFYSYKHGRSLESRQTFWHMTRRPAARTDDHGTEVYLHLVDLGFNPRLPSAPVLTVHTTCTNRDLPVLLRRAGEDLSFELEQAAPLAGIRCLQPPTPPQRLPLGRGVQWRLISHLSLNHLSLSDAVEGRDALQEILSLYDFADTANTREATIPSRQMIEGITAVASRPAVDLIRGPISSAFCRGREIEIEFDEEKYVGTGAFLFACVLERFLGLYVSMNSFSRLVGKKQGKGVFKRWPPRTGELPLL